MPARERVIYPHLENPPTPHTCQMCGLCCISIYTDPYYVEVEPEELPHMPADFVKKLVAPEFDRYAIRAVRAIMRKGPLKGLAFKVCAALTGNVLDRVECSIYEHRPLACRDFPMGGLCCTRIRRETLANLNARSPFLTEGCLTWKKGKR